MKKTLRCAIYTRKSSEEGLEQEFNSLDAQREACEAYIKSQKNEGWKLLPAYYDDGGFSGGNIERPGLKRLLEDIQAKKVDIVVVYKVDRLTRSLKDFAQIIDVFDKAGASFVSITQQFNTTTSMGRLTLNVLLSFAQFEREVTSERIRDKIAASKAKGMWMGGGTPLGYKIEDKKLIPCKVEAKLIQHIFERYIELKSVYALKDELNAGNHKLRSGKVAKFWAGPLYKLLNNKTYIAKIVHKDKEYGGEHKPLINNDLWNKVQKQLQENAVVRTESKAKASAFLLTGLLFDEQGRPLSPTHSNKKGKRYRYYITSIADPRSTKAEKKARIPAEEIEKLVCNELRGVSPLYARTSEQILVQTLVAKIVLSAEQITIKTKTAEGIVQHSPTHHGFNHFKQIFFIQIF